MKIAFYQVKYSPERVAASEAARIAAKTTDDTNFTRNLDSKAWQSVHWFLQRKYVGSYLKV